MRSVAPVGSLNPDSYLMLSLTTAVILSANAAWGQLLRRSKSQQCHRLTLPSFQIAKRAVRKERAKDLRSPSQRSHPRAAVAAAALVARRVAKATVEAVAAAKSRNVPAREALMHSGHKLEAIQPSGKDSVLEECIPRMVPSCSF